MAQGHAPFAPHLHYGIFLDEETERNIGMECGKAFLLKCDEVWLFTSHGISKGMTQEVEFANENGIRVVQKGVR